MSRDPRIPSKEELDAAAAEGLALRREFEERTRGMTAVSCCDAANQLRAAERAFLEATRRADDISDAWYAEKRRADEAEANARRSEAHCRRAEDVARAVRAKNERLWEVLEDIRYRCDKGTAAEASRKTLSHLVALALDSIHDKGLAE